MKENNSSVNENKPLEYFVRSADHSDISMITTLIFTVCEAEEDTATSVTEEELQNEWTYEGFSPQNDAFVAVDKSGNLLGYAAVYDVDRHCELSGDIYLHPGVNVNLIGAALLQAMQNRSMEHVPFAPEDETVLLRVAVDNRNEWIKNLFLNMGFQAVRYHWRMEITLEQAPVLPDFPNDIELRPFDWQKHAHSVWQSRNVAFAENWGSRELNFEEFAYYTKEHPEFDPSLWQTAW